jgi:iron complex outermembrane receptor protein
MKILISRFGKLGWWLSLVIALTPKMDADEVTMPAPAGDKTNSQVLATYKKMSLDELMDQEVTSVAKQPQSYAQAPAAINVITGDEIRRSGASSIPEALRLADNLEVAQQNSHDWNISARGFNASQGNKLLVLIDGRAVYTPLYGGVLWNMQDYLLEDIDRIEVISGPGGTLWGANAVNGVINITSKSAKDTQGLYLEAGGGTELQDFTGFRYGGMLASNVFFRVYGKYFDLNDEVFANGNDASDSARKGQGGFRIDAEPSLQNVFTVQGDLYAGHENLPTGDERIGGGNILGRWTHTISDDSDTSLQAYYDRTHLSFPYGAPLGTLVDDLDTYDLDFQHRFSLGERNKIVWGLGYRFTHEVEGNAHQVLFLPPIQDHSLFSGFLQDEIKLHEKLFLTLGTKLEHNDFTGFEVEPSARLQWNLTSKQMIWAAVSRAVRTPSRFDRDLDIPTFLPPPLQTFQSGGTDFESETVIAYELGYRAQLGSKVSASISAFYNDYDHLRSLNPGPATNFFLPHVFANGLEGDTYGFELSTDYQILDWWRLHGGYDLLKENIHVKPGQTDLDNSLNETADPQQQFSIRSSMDLPFRTELDAAFRWVDIIHNNNGGTPGTVPSYGELDVRIGWHATKNLEISIVGQNLLHDQHPESGFPGSGQEQITRSVFGKIAWRF